MSHDDDLDLFKEIMGDVKRIDHDTAEHQKVHRVTESHLANRETLCGCLTTIKTIYH